METHKIYTRKYKDGILLKTDKSYKFSNIFGKGDNRYNNRYNDRLIGGVCPEGDPDCVEDETQGESTLGENPMETQEEESTLGENPMETQEGESTLGENPMAETDGTPDQSEQIPSIDVNDITKSEPSVPVPTMAPSQIPLHTIQVGTVLYHGSKDIAQFNPSTMNLGTNSLVGMFSTDMESLRSYIGDCILYPKETGYIHKFKVTKPIDKIYIKSSIDRDLAWSEDVIKAEFCDGNKFGFRLNGVGFFKKDGSPQNPESNARFALCSPSDFLTYVGTYSCIATGKLSSVYNFNN